MTGALPKFPLVFYKATSGREPVRDWLWELPDEDCQAIGMDLMRAQFRWPVGMPLCRPMGQGLFEIRSRLPSSRIARVFICQVGTRLVALHGFIKKTQATPKADLDLALQRMKELQK
jgi:phage-related protein